MSFKKIASILIIFSVCVMFCSTQEGHAQSKRELRYENENLRKTIDSLKALLAEGIELADTTNVGDTINPAGIGIIDDDAEMYVNAIPGSNSDSLLSVWYLQKQMSLFNEGNINLDSANFVSDIPDEVYISNLKKINSYIPVPYNSIVKNYIIFYTQKIPHKSATILGLARYYIPIFEAIFDYYDMPKELAAVAIIESALNPFAVSRARAKGMWQFMYTTARQYDLELSSYVDERLDPVASCDAAARYLRDAYAIFGDWALAISSYNCGAGNVNKAIRRSGSKNFWDLYRYLPRETRGYVPSFVGALYLLNYYKQFNIVPDKISMPAHLDTFMVHKNLHFEQLSNNLDISVEDLRELNPQYIHDIIPASERGHILRLPYALTNPFIEKEQEIYAYKDSVYFNPIVTSKYANSGGRGGSSDVIRHRVRSGQTLSHIAVKYGVTVAQIKRWNNLKKTTLRIGQVLTIYPRGGGYTPSRASSSKARSTGSSSSGGYTKYTIRKGDSLWEIARKHNMSLNDLLKLNGLTNKSKILPGKTLKVKN